MMAAAPLTLVLLAVTGQVAALSSDKPFVTAEDTARVDLRVVDEAGSPVRDAAVTLTVNVGTLTEPVLTPEGVFTATYQPPSEEGAQVALLHAWVRRGEALTSTWLALPVHGRHLLRVSAPPRSRVSVSVGAASFGPVRADARGDATVPVQLPPGVSSAQVTTVDRARRTRTQGVPLPEPRFARLRLASPTEAPVGDEPVRLQGFVVDGSGNPALALPPLAVSVDRGTLGPIEPKEGGVFEVSYTAPSEAGAPVILSATSLGVPAPPFTLQVETAPSPPAPVAQAAPPPAPPEVAAPPPAPPPSASWRPTVGGFLFAQSNAALSKGLGLRLEAGLQLAELPLEALLHVEARQNGEETQALSAGNDSVRKAFKLGGFGARLGLRWSHPLWSRGVLFTDASAGFLRMSGSVRLVGMEDATEQALRSQGLAVAVGGGLGWAVGPGRVSGQLQWAYAPGSGQVQGNLGGLSLGLGYQLRLGAQGP